MYCLITKTFEELQDLPNESLKKIIAYPLNDNEKEVYESIVDAINKSSNFNDQQKNKVIRHLAAYMILKNRK